MSLIRKLSCIDKAICLIFIFELVIILFSFDRLNFVNNVKGEETVKYEFDGKGTFDSPYLISDSDDLVKLSELVNSGNSFSNLYFKITNDIDMVGISMNPIGIYESGNYFNGILDGDGHKISNITINSDDYAGLFGMLGGTVMNLGIDSGFIGNQDYLGCSGGIASHAVSSSARIINCYNNATVGGYRAGGIADNFVGIIINCWSDCELRGVEVGGITSYYSSLGAQVFCYSTSELMGNGSQNWFACKTVRRKELYSQSMANRLSANCLIWFETMTPSKQLNGWEFENGEIFLNGDKVTYFSISNIFWLLIYSAEYYKWVVYATVLLMIEIVIIIVVKVLRKRNLI